jgi:hypothetical protein
LQPEESSKNTFDIFSRVDCSRRSLLTSPEINGLKVKVFIELNPSTLQNYTYQEIILYLAV